jgi:hypothetical protein
MDLVEEKPGITRYNAIKERIQKNITFQLSQFGFALKCQYALCNRFQGNFPYGIELNEDMIRTLKNNDNVYINMHTHNLIEAINHFINIIYEKNLKLNFYIMGEPTIDENIVYILLYYTNEMYLQNNNFDHPKIHNMPLGIRDGEEVFPAHEHFSQNILLNESKQKREKQYLCYMCFKDSHSERLRCEEMLGEKEFVLNLIKNEYPPQLSIHCWKVPVELNYKCTHESYYTLSPTGLGQATHRFFEAIYLDSIPIVKRTNTSFDKLYNVFPCLIVNDWDEVTRELLESNLEDYMNELKEFKQKYPNLYTTLEGIDELIIQT